MSTYPLQEYVQATANSDGEARATAGPFRYGEHWEIHLITTNTNSTAESQLRVYRGVESDTALILSTYAGNQDTAGGGKRIILPAGDKLVFVWSDADIGSICTARIEGDINSRRR